MLRRDFMRAIEPLHHRAYALAFRRGYGICHDPQRHIAHFDVARVTAGEARQHVALMGWIAMEHIERLA
jgi:hypothetical protein